MFEFRTEIRFESYRLLFGKDQRDSSESRHEPTGLLVNLAVHAIILAIRLTDRVECRQFV